MLKVEAASILKIVQGTSCSSSRSGGNTSGTRVFLGCCYRVLAAFTLSIPSLCNAEL